MAKSMVYQQFTNKRRSSYHLVRILLSYLALIVLSVVFIAPLIWMLSTSFKSNAESISLPLTWIPRTFSVEGYTEIFSSYQTPVIRWFTNSLVSAIAHMLLVLVTAAPAAYALARMRFRGKGVMFAMIISTLFIPHIIFLTPNYLIVDYLGWLDTLWAIVVPGAADAFGVFLLRQFFVALPRELEEAALLDGADRFQIFTRIVLPLAKPALATLAVLSFLSNWNAFLWPVYVLFNPESLTLPPGLATLQDGYVASYAVHMAGGVIASVPVLLLFIFAQRYVTEGVARSGIKG